MVIWNQAWTRAEGKDRVRSLYEKTFEEAPQIVWSAPGRVNLIGEHTDYNGGLSLPIAIPQRTYVAVSLRSDRQVRLVSAQESGLRTIDLEKVGRFDTEGRVDGWPAYVAGVAWAIEQTTGQVIPGFDIAVDSCVPYGAGLSSSAALEAAVAGALVELCGVDASKQQIVQWCVMAENEVAGAPTGGMDQSAVMLCEPGHALLVDFGSGRNVNVEFALDDLALLVVDTRASHSLVDGQYAQRRDTCVQAASTLGVANLAKVENLAAALESLDDPEQKKRVRHVVTEIERTRQAVDALQRKDFQQLGTLFVESHDSLRDDYEVSCPELDNVVDTALQNGALGARMTGGGFGGSAIAIVPKDGVPVVAEAIVQAFAEKGFGQPVMLEAWAGEPAGRES